MPYKNGYNYTNQLTAERAIYEPLMPCACTSEPSYIGSSFPVGNMGFSHVAPRNFEYNYMMPHELLFNTLVVMPPSHQFVGAVRKK